MREIRLQHLSFLSAVTLVAGTFVYALPVHAQQSAADGDELRAIEVYSDSNVPETGEVDTQAFTGSHRSIKGDVLQRRDLGVGQIIAQESGVQSRQVGGFGTFSSITVRAASPAQTGVFLDGILLNSGGNAVVDLSMLNLFALDEIAIYRGTSPAQLSHASIGGAVNLVTPKVESENPETRLLVGVSSFATSRAQIMHRRKLGALEVLGAFSYEQSENDFEFLDSNGTPLNAGDDSKQSRNNAAVSKTTLLARVAYQAQENRKTDVVLQATVRHAGVPEWRNNANNQASLDTHVARLQVSQSFDSLGDWNSRYTVFAHNDHDAFDDRLSQVGLSAQDSRTDIRVFGVKSYWEYLGDTHTSSITFDARTETLNAQDKTDPRDNRKATRKALTGGLQTLRYFIDDRLLVSPSLRMQFNDNKFSKEVQSSAGQNIKQSESDAVFNPQLGVSFEVRPTFVLRANAGQFYRAPTFSELFGSRGLLQGNEALLPEAGVNADLGFLWSPAQHFSLDTSLFASWRDELIATVFDSRGVGRAINVGQARIVGLEAAVNWQFNEHLSARVNITLQDAISQQKFAAFDGKQLPGEARHSAYARLQYSRQAWSVYLETTGLWNRFYDQANVLPARDQWLQTLGIKWHKGPLGLTATLNNLSNRQVEDFNGFPRPGRSITFNVAYIL